MACGGVGSSGVKYQIICLSLAGFVETAAHHKRAVIGGGANFQGAGGDECEIGTRYVKGSGAVDQTGTLLLNGVSQAVPLPAFMNMPASASLSAVISIVPVLERSLPDSPLNCVVPPTLGVSRVS